MKTLRFLHIGDMHLDQKYLKKIEPSLNQILDYCKENRINAVIIPGDIWHTKQSYSSYSAVPVLLNFLRKLSQLVDFIFITKGNHDEPGSITLLHQLEPNIYSYEYPVCLAIGKDEIRDLLRYESIDETFNYIISLIPYPTKSMFLSDDSIDNNNANFVEKFEEVFELIGETTQPYTCPKLLGFHGNVVGSRLSTGQTLQSQDIMVAPSTLEKAKADYYALNHIHLRQEIRPNMVYAGGIANFNWGETEPKSFQVVTFFDNEMSVEKVMLTYARPMIIVDAELINGELFWDKSLLNEETKDAEFRFRCKVKENERKLITNEKINALKEIFGDDVKIEFNIIPLERESRSDKIMNCKTLIDEVKEYAAVIEQPINGNIEKKVAEMQGVAK